MDWGVVWRVRGLGGSWGHWAGLAQGLVDRRFWSLNVAGSEPG